MGVSVQLEIYFPRDNCYSGNSTEPRYSPNTVIPTVISIRTLNPLNIRRTLINMLFKNMITLLSMYPTPRKKIIND